MSNMKEDGFSAVFEQAAGQKKLPFNSFRSDPAYAFVCPVGDHITTPEIEAITLGIEIDRDLFSSYLQIPKPDLGYEGKKYVALDTIDCRHMMMSTIAFSGIEDEIKNVVEIGGGYGNWAYLNLKTSKYLHAWTIIDLPFVLDLQEWFLFNTNLDCQLLETLSFVEPGEAVNNKPDLIIGAHSLSELAWEDFISYSNLMLSTKYMFYAFHIYWPHPELIARKEAFLLEHFDIIKNVTHLGGTAKNYLLQRKALK